MDATDQRKAITQWMQNEEHQPFDELLNDCEEAMKLFRELIISRIEAPLMDRLYQMPQSNKHAMSTVCDLINSTAEKFGLLVRCPKSGYACRLGVVQQGDERPMFSFNPQAPSRPKPWKFHRFTVLPPIELVVGNSQTGVSIPVSTLDR